MEGKDAKFETVSSSKIQPAIMVRRDTRTLQKVALIFVKNSEKDGKDMVELELEKNIDKLL